MIESIPSLIGLVVLLIVLWAVFKFVLRLTARIIGCSLTAIAVLGLLVVIWIFFL